MVLTGKPRRVPNFFTHVRLSLLNQVKLYCPCLEEGLCFMLSVPRIRPSRILHLPFNENNICPLQALFLTSALSKVNPRTYLSSML